MASPRPAGSASSALAYTRQRCPQSLEQGIADYHSAYPDLMKLRDLSPAAAEFFRRHDAVHVVYGCTNALNDEAIVKISSIFGTTGGLGVLRGYRLHESLDIYRKLRARDVLASIICSACLVPRSIYRCARQRDRWPWDDFARFLPLPLDQLRAQFGIRVAHSDGGHP